MATTKPHASFYVGPEVWASFTAFCEKQSMKQGAAFERAWQFFIAPRTKEIIARLAQGLAAGKLSADDLESLQKLGEMAKNVSAGGAAK